MIQTIKTEFIEAIISKKELEDLLNANLIPNLDNLVLISISDPLSTITERKAIENKYSNQFHNSLKVKFYDVTKKLSMNGNDTIDYKTVLIMKNFILKHKDKKFIINCNAGRSRSAGVGLLVEFLLGKFDDLYHFRTSYNDVISSHKRYFPNLIVLDTLFKKGEDNENES